MRRWATPGGHVVSTSPSEPLVCPAVSLGLRISPLNQVVIPPSAGMCKILQHRLGGTLRMRTDAVTAHSSPGQVFYLMLPVDDAFETACLKYSDTR